MKRKALLWTAVTAWAAAVVLGNALLFLYSAAPGRGAEAPDRWPTQTHLVLASATPTLIMVAHPKCSCTHASIGELARLMSRLSGEVTGYVLFVRPDGFEAGWERTGLWESAKLVPGVEVLDDPGGVEAARFGAKTSGQVLLYDTGGSLLFRGGITPSRAHFGNSVGRERIISLVTAQRADRAVSEVFGCSLEDEDASEIILSDFRRGPDWN